MSDMNSLDTQLRLSLEMPDVCLDRPVVDIVNRGKRLKRRRRLALAAGASATALVVVTSTALLS
ncbi:hypothetical protein QOZ75_29620, partial [Pseudomonas aeruginosa]|uniref:hypothetical protein n=1 Tax=Pseudomonas aeruginosa TaxID=287 RepID=UPI0034586030